MAGRRPRAVPQGVPPSQCRVRSSPFQTSKICPPDGARDDTGCVASLGARTPALCVSDWDAPRGSGGQLRLAAPLWASGSADLAWVRRAYQAYQLTIVIARATTKARIST